jgi:hypothetical protein
MKQKKFFRIRINKTARSGSDGSAHQALAHKPDRVHEPQEHGRLVGLLLGGQAREEEPLAHHHAKLERQLQLGERRTPTHRERTRGGRVQAAHVHQRESRRNQRDRDRTGAAVISAQARRRGLEKHLGRKVDHGRLDDHTFMILT